MYFGWARLDVLPGWPASSSAAGDGHAHKMVMNVRRRPSVSGDEETDVSVEVHLLHAWFPADFHGNHLRVVVLRCWRPEMRFATAS